MRSIKFRVWHHTLNKFITADEWYLDLNGRLCFLDIKGITDDYLIEVEENLYTAQQYTGIKDKNGVEIYEGDIVAFTEWGVPESWVHNYLNDGLKIVKWSLNAGGDYPFAGFTFIKYNAGDLDIGVLVDCMNIQYCKVIGNIFENKDLLK